jgi:Bacterial Ig-like domain
VTLLPACAGAPPQIITLSPARGSTSVTADAPVTVVFDHAIDRSSLAPRFGVDPPLGGCDLERAFSAPATAPCHVAWQPHAATFVLEHRGAIFRPSTKYTFHIEPGVRDTTGAVNSLDHHWDITSGPAPQLLGSSPSDGSVNVPVDSPVVVSFNDLMDGVATTAAIHLTPAVAGTRVVANSRDHGRFLILPGRLLDPVTAYTVTIDRGARDEHLQPLQRSVMVRFRTGGLIRAGHALVLAGRRGEAASAALLTGLGAFAEGEPAPATTVLLAPRCTAPACGAVPLGGTLTGFLEATASPDGRRLAVVERDETAAAAPSQLHVVDLATGLDTVVASDAAHPSWSPDGHLLAFGDAQGVHLLDPVTGAARLLPPGDPLAASPAWSGDGSVLALPVRAADASLHVDLADPTLEVRYPVPQLRGEVTSPALNPDGSELAVRRDGSPSLEGTWLVRLRGGDPTPRRLAAGMTPVAYIDASTLLAVDRAPQDTPGLVRIGVRGGDVAHLATGPAASDLGSVTAATPGGQIAYLLADADGVTQAFIENADGSHPAPLTSFSPQGLEAVAVSFAG